MTYLAIRVERKLKATDVIDVLSDLFILLGALAYPRSAPGRPRGARQPWENGCVESFNAHPSDELLNGEIFYMLPEAQIIIESWRRHYTAIHPHGSLGCRPPAPEVFAPITPAWPSPPTQPAPTAPLPLAP